MATIKMSKSQWEFIGNQTGWLKTEEAKKKGKKVNPWAVCNKTVGKKENPEKFERCVMDVKEKHPIKKD